MPYDLDTFNAELHARTLAILHAATTDTTTRPKTNAQLEAEDYWAGVGEDRAAEARGDHTGQQERDTMSDLAAEADEQRRARHLEWWTT